MYGDSAIRWLAMAIATLFVAAVGTAGVYVFSSEGSARDATRSLSAVGVVAAEEAPATTASAPPPPTTVPPVTTIVPPRPVTTVSAPVATSPPAPPTRAQPVAALSAAQRCTEALAWAAAHGLVLPSGWSYRCPGPVGSGGAGQYWGRACMNLVGECPGTAFVAIDVDLIGPSDATLHYVLAHEICHAIELETTNTTSEPTADACAAAHGAPRA